jgi:hypothetical protein
MSDDDAPKSAFEIAMEKLRSQGGFEEKKLTDGQKAEIADVRSRYRARIAQLEIESESKLAQATSLEELETQKAEVAKEKQRLNREMEEKVENIRER